MLDEVTLRAIRDAGYAVDDGADIQDLSDEMLTAMAEKAAELLAARSVGAHRREVDATLTRATQNGLAARITALEKERDAAVSYGKNLENALSVREAECARVVADSAALLEHLCAVRYGSPAYRPAPDHTDATATIVNAPRPGAALLERVKRLEEKARIGAQMANACYNLVQQKTMSPEDILALDRLRHEWDAAGH